MNKLFRLMIIFLVAILVVKGSIFFNSIFVMDEDSVDNINIDLNLTVREFLNINSLPDKFILNSFDINKDDFNKKLNSLNVETESIKKRYALYHEEITKNFKKIIVKFVLWIIFLFIMFFLLKNKMLNYKNRTYFYLISFTLFGIILGADPSSMGTVKDAIVLYGKHNVFFMPRMIAMIVFFISVLLANKFICAWGCQLGTLQDFIFNMNRNKNFNSIFFKQIKIKFWISNTIRFLFFIGLFYFSFVQSIDIFETIDPFKIFKFNKVIGAGLIFIPFIFFLSLFIYRPWCSLFCPFGLISWVLEKVSFKKIRVDTKKCINCRKCVEKCPSYAMKGILDKKKFGQDCFSCGICQEICPVKAIDFK